MKEGGFKRLKGYDPKFFLNFRGKDYAMKSFIDSLRKLFVFAGVMVMYEL